MATLAQILSRRFPRNQWTLQEDDYSTLDWDAGNPAPKPAEAEIRALSDEVDDDLAQENRKRRQQQALMVDNVDAVLRALEIIIKGQAELYRVVNDLRGKVQPAALSGTLTSYDSAVIQAVSALRTRIDEIRAMS